ncbi:hypothetical protein MLD52_23520, partial [Puniceicoccaceae bacterium K14]|nr:hypothetical protein [Puniceicoccaceae bacterium K14]
CFDLTACAILHGDRNIAAIGFEYPRVGYGAFTNISAEVLEGVDSVSKILHVAVLFSASLR